MVDRGIQQYIIICDRKMFYDTGHRGRSTKSCPNNCFSNCQSPSRQCWVILSTCNFLNSLLSQPPKIIPKLSDLTLPHPKGHVDKCLCWQKICCHKLHWQNVTLKNVTLTKHHIYKMSHWQDVTLTRCHIDKMSHWHNATLTKCHIDKMPHWKNAGLRNVMLTCQVDKMSSLQNVKLTKCHAYKISSWQNVLAPPSQNTIHWVVPFPISSIESTNSFRLFLSQLHLSATKFDNNDIFLWIWQPPCRYANNRVQ